MSRLSCPPGCELDSFDDPAWFVDGGPVKLGRNEMPAALFEAFWSGQIDDPARLRRLVADAWTMAEHPRLTTA